MYFPESRAVLNELFGSTLRSGRGIRAIYHNHGQIGIRHGLAAALDAKLFNQFVRLANAGGIDNPDGNSFEIHGFRN